MAICNSEDDEEIFEPNAAAEVERISVASAGPASGWDIAAANIVIEPVAAVEANELTAPPPTIAAPLPPSASSAAERARLAYARAVAPPSRELFPDAPPFKLAADIDPDRLAELEAVATEIHLVSADLGDVFLVREHTEADRHELTFREAATLRLLVEQFPGARVVDLRRPGLAHARASRPEAAQPPAAAPALAIAAGWDE